MYRIEVDNLGKRFGERKVFSKISFDLKAGESIAIVGRNGSGKSTLLKVLLSLLIPTRGSVLYLKDSEPMDEAQIRQSVSFVAPYLNLYDHLTAEENIKFFTAMTGDSITGKEINNLMERVGLEGRGMDFVYGYSSGMKQRLKYAVALLKKPSFLFLDEPTSNLDDDGKKIVFDLIEEYRQNAIIIVATNENEEYNLAQRQCRVDQ